jgi:hypothetical protein
MKGNMACPDKQNSKFVSLLLILKLFYRDSVCLSSQSLGVSNANRALSKLSLLSNTFSIDHRGLLIFERSGFLQTLRLTGGIVSRQYQAEKT